MHNHYYNSEDLMKFGNISEYQKDLADKFFNCYGAVPLPCNFWTKRKEPLFDFNMSLSQVIVTV
jgi:hypothetical protein